jgi:hypothetical protein
VVVGFADIDPIDGAAGAHLGSNFELPTSNF